MVNVIPLSDDTHVKPNNLWQGRKCPMKNARIYLRNMGMKPQNRNPSLYQGSPTSILLNVEAQGHSESLEAINY
jgi:hypothetical protein